MRKGPEVREGGGCSNWRGQCVWPLVDIREASVRWGWGVGSHQKTLVRKAMNKSLDFKFQSSGKLLKDLIQVNIAESCLILATPWTVACQSPLEKEKLKFYITSCSFCLCNSACFLQSLGHICHAVSKWGLTILGTIAYLTHPCPAVCNHPAPANLLNHACPCIKTL